MFGRRAFPVLCLVLFLISTTSRAEVVQGDSTVGGQTFNVPVRAAAFDELFGVSCFGARQIGAKDYAIAVHFCGSTRCFPYTPEKVKLNNCADSQNPLYNSSIAHLAFVMQQTGAIVTPERAQLAVCMADNPNTVYLFDEFDDLAKISLLSTSSVKDASGDQVTSGVVSLCGGLNGLVYAAVKAHAGDHFGAVGSGVALLERTVLTDKNVPEGCPEGPVLKQIDAGRGKPASESLTRAVALSEDMDVIKIGGQARILDDAIDMYLDRPLNCLYVVVQAQGADGQDDGVCALVVGNVVLEAKETAGDQPKISYAQKIEFKKVAGDRVFLGAHDKIVGARGAGAQVLLHKVCTMHTSTGLHYVVVLGGNGDGGQTRRHVYALPIVCNSSYPAIHGMLANKNCGVVDHYQREAPYGFTGRNFPVPALFEGDLYTASDAPACVGDGPIAWGDVTDLWVISDAVFVAVGNPDAGQVPGVAYSRALFDATGKITGWTIWQRITGSVDHVYRATTWAKTMTSLSLSGSDEQELTVLKQTVWADGTQNGLQGLGVCITKNISPATGGVFSLADYAVTTPGLSGISALVATGNNTVLLAQTGVVKDGALWPLLGEHAFEQLSCENATVPVDLPTDDVHVLVFKDGELAPLGPIAASEIARAGNVAWLFVGGVNGLAVLMDSNGIGWQADIGLGDGFLGLRAGTAFKKVGNYSYVRKLMCDGGYLYVLCDDRLDRIDLASSDFAAGQLAAVTIASCACSETSSLSNVLSDVLVSGKLAFLSSSSGLYRSGDGVDIRLADSVQSAKWTRIALDEGDGRAHMMQAISKTGRAQDVTRFGGMVYVLSAYYGNDSAQAYRFAVLPLSADGGVNTQTVQKIPDFFVKDQPSYFVNFDGYRDWLLSDGAFFVHACCRNQPHDALVRLLPAKMSSGARFLAAASSPLPLALRNCSTVLPMIRSSASGAWLLPVDGGLKINE